MKNFSRKFTRILFTIAVLTLIVNTAFSQRKLSEPNGVDYTYPMKLIKPLVMPEQSYGVDVVQQVGVFDNTQVSTTSGFAETDICVNPNNPLNFVATDNRITGFSGARYIYYTLDGGVTWLANTSVTSNQGDPVFTADKLGNFYMAILNSGVYVWKSTNGGVSWTGPTLIVSNANADKEWIWADQTTGTYQNNVYMAYVNFSTNSVDFFRSTNNGSSWTGPTPMGFGTPNPGPNICTGPTGRVYVFWYGGGGATLKISTDGGATFGSSINATSNSNPGSVNGSGRYVLKTDIRVNGMPQAACDMTTGPFAGYVYCAYATNPPGPDAADVGIARSTDGGLTWNGGVRVNDDVFGTINDQWMTDVAVDNQGRVWMFWWDSRNDLPNNILCETWAAVSTDGGLTFQPNFKVSSQWNPAVIKINQGSQHYYLGDYQALSGKSFVLPFTIGNNNNLQNYTAYLPDYGMSFAKSVDSINQNGSGTNTVFIPMMGPYSGTVTYTTSVSPSPAPGTLTFNWSPSNVAVLTGTPSQLGLTIIASATVPQQLYTVTVTAAESGGPRTHSRTFNVLVGNFTGLQHNGNEVPEAYQLFQNYPNPFNPSTVIYYSLPKQTMVNIKVYDIIGQEVAALVDNAIQQPGEHNLTFDASKLPSGIYYYKMITSEFTDVKKMVLIK